MSHRPRPGVISVCLGALLLFGCRSPEPPAARPVAVAQAPLPEPLREFRGVWVATVGNIDWPSAPALPVAEQQRELRAILDRAVQLRLNAVILQVRPAGDVLYESPHEPWSEFLTGQMGRAPQPRYDPLAFAIAEAHRRGLELHAWINPYRASHPKATGPVSGNHVSRARPEWVRRYGKYKWLDPGEPAVTEYVVNIVRDIVRRYDVDGIHLDDYFYPYPEANLEFPDDATYRRHGGGRTRADWRRENVNGLIRQLYSAVKQTKPWVRVGISPFGIWRSGTPPGIRGTGAFDNLYADSRLWLENGWLDYLAPQLYWRIAEPEQSFPVLLKWWDAQNRAGRHVWPGLFTSRVQDGTARAWPAGEILDQLALVRGRGAIHFSMKPLLENRDGIASRLAAGPYAEPALVPAAPWLGSRPPARPVIAFAADQRRVAWTAGDAEPVRGWVVQTANPTGWTTRLLPGGQRVLALDAATTVAVRAVDRYGNVGEPGIASPVAVR